MSSPALATWTVVALLAVMTPGLDTMLVLRHTLFRGGRGGMAVVVGIAAGCLAWASASLAGLTALLAASTIAYDVVRVAGALYLIWLGLTSIWKTLPRNRAATTSINADAQHGRSGIRAGFFTNLLNPKVGVFYISLLPQFLPTGPSATAWGVLLVAIHLMVTVIWFPALIAVAVKARGALLGDRVRAWMERATAAVLIGVGIRLATEAR